MSDAPLAIEVLLLVRDLFDGRVTIEAVSDSEMFAIGEEESARTEIRMALSECFATTYADQLSRFSLPPGVELHRQIVEVEHQRADRRVVPVPLEVHAAIVPAKSGRWIMIPTLFHTFLVTRSDDLEASIASEVRRMVAVRQGDAYAFLDLLPARRTRLELMSIAVERTERGSSAKGRKAALKAQVRAEALKVLRSVGQEVADRDEVRRGPPIVGRQSELTTLGRLLEGPSRASALIVGEPLVGKSALLHQWIRDRRKAGETPLVFSTSGAQLLAGMSGLGQWQARIRRVLEAAARVDAILYFEDLADLFLEQGKSKIDLPGAMKRALEESQVRVVGELTPALAERLSGENLGFFSFFTRIRLEALTAAQAHEALTLATLHVDKHLPEQPTLTEDAVTTLVDLTERYLPYRPFPGKSMRLYQDLCAAADGVRDEAGRPLPITTRRILSFFSARTGIPEFLLREDRALSQQATIDWFGRRLVGQASAVEAVVDTICVVKARLQPAGKPLATFLFVGPTGVGKTELARSLATFLFGSEDRLIRFDMSEYADPLAADRLIRGGAGAEGLLTRQVRRQPFCVILLDEVEKAHPAVFDLLLGVTGEGRLTDAKGNTASFHNAIIIMTSNVGARQAGRAQIGIARAADEERSRYLDAVEKTFRPEFVNRLDRIIPFAPLSETEIRSVAQLALDKIVRRRGITERGIQLQVSQRALEQLIQGGYSPDYGARALRRHLEEQLVAPVAELVAHAGPTARGGVIEVLEATEKPSGQWTVAVERGPLRALLKRLGKERKQQIPWKVSGWRRQIDLQLNADSIVEIREQLSLLRSQLSSQGAGRGRRDVSRIMQEHHDLAEVYNPAIELRDELVMVEDLTLSAFLAGDPFQEYEEEAHGLFQEINRSLAKLLLAKDGRYDNATLVVHELDSGQALNHWLLPLLQERKQLGFIIDVHAFGEEATDWPKARSWGPPLNVVELERRLSVPGRPALVFLLTVRGPFAGSFMALEAGLHAMIDMHARVSPARMKVRLAGMRSELSEKDWKDPELSPYGRNWEVKGERPVRTRYPENVRVPGHRNVRLSRPGRYWAEYYSIAVQHLGRYERDMDLDRDALFEGIWELRARGKEKGKA